MLINNIELVNFRQFKGHQKIVFPNSKEDNITVVLGQNTGGKTTLVRAFVWCLYGDNSFSDKILLNAEEYAMLSDPMTVSGTFKEVKVKLNITHNSIDYILERKILYESTNRKRPKATASFSMYKSVGSNFEPIEGASAQEEEINSILPEELAKYFFFWGEKIENISNNRGLESEIKEFLGLDVLSEAQRYLDDALRNFRSLKVNSGDDELKKYDLSLKTAESNLKIYRRKLDETNKDIDSYNETIEKLNQKLINNASTKEIQIRNNENEERLIELKYDYENETERIQKWFSEKFYVVASLPFMEQSKNQLKSRKEEVQAIRGMNTDAIKEIINRKVCVCGTEVLQGSQEYQELIKWLDILPPQTLGTLTKDFLDEINEKNNLAVSALEEIDTHFKQRARYEEQINQLEYNLAKDKARVANSDNMLNVQEELDATKHKIKLAEVDRDNYLKKITGYERDVKTVESYIERYESKNEDNRKIDKYIKFATAARDEIRDELKRQEDIYLSELNKYIKEYFNQVYHGQRTIEISSDYKIRLYSDVSGTSQETEVSPGLETVKNFAFIAGLISMAKNKIYASEDLEGILTPEPYPIVLDAPFSSADEEHVPKIADLISDVSEQTILVVMEKDWNFAKESLDNKASLIIELDKINETHTEIKVLRGEQ